MTDFVHLDLPNYNQSLEERTQLPKFCVCCLHDNIPLINLANCKHTRILEFIYRSKKQNSSYKNAAVCSFCHYELKKCDLFISQVEESLTVNLFEISTATYSKIQNSLTNKNTVILKRSNLELNSTIDSQPIEFEIIAPVAAIDIETSVKIEHDSSDFETDVPLSQIKTQNSSQQNSQDVTPKKVKVPKLKKEIKKNAKPKRTPKMPLKKKYGGKINIVMLSMKEMLLEREKDALKKNYLKLPFKCETCITGFDHESTLIEHIEKRHSKNGLYRCGICNSVLSNRSSYNEHRKRHLRRYECCECGKRNNNVYSVLQHYSEQHGNIDVNYECNLCDFTADSYRSYRYHREKHRFGKVECDRCDSTFVNKGGLRVHMITIHGESSREYSCEECGRSYRCKSSMAAHLARHSSTPAYCVECDTHFRSEFGLKNHLKTHSKHVLDADKRFTCNECGSKFLKKSSLQEHIDWTHLNNIKFACNKCSKVFKNRSSLRKHKDFVHDKKRPPRNKICDHCGRGFTTTSILQSHIRTHTGERPLQCPHCPATFAHSAALYTHNKLLHTVRAT